jgi:hypothetical protein
MFPSEPPLRVVKRTGPRYFLGVATLSKLLLLLAMMVMPFGMAPATAASHHPPTAGTPMQHCPEQGSKHESKGSFAECTMACSAALPAADRRAGEPILITSAPIAPAALQALHGLHPETATPPPKPS